jgi:DNA-binding NarL/FixJ family response regulator
MSASTADPNLPTEAVPVSADSRPARYSSLRVALVDADPLSHETLSDAFRAQAPDWRLDSHFDPESAAQATAASPPDVLLLDIWDPKTGEPALLRRLRALFPSLPVIPLTKSTTGRAIVLSLMAGASGFLLEPICGQEIVQAINDALLGSLVLCCQSRSLLGKTLREIDQAATATSLTQREKEAMLHLAHVRRKEIGDSLGVSDSTVHAHLNNAFRKLRARNKTDAIRKFFLLD